MSANSELIERIERLAEWIAEDMPQIDLPGELAKSASAQAAQLRNVRKLLTKALSDLDGKLKPERA